MDNLTSDEKIKYLEEKIKKINIEHPICNWTTYNGSHCRRTISGEKFCNLHKQMILHYEQIKEESSCSSCEEIKVIPRSYAHIKSVMKNIDNEDDLVEVYISKGLIEEADLSDKSCITILSDDFHYYYNPRRGQSNAKNIKVVLRKYCQNNSIIKIEDNEYCEECYKKLKGVPKITVFDK